MEKNYYNLKINFQKAQDDHGLIRDQGNFNALRKSNSLSNLNQLYNEQPPYHPKQNNAQLNKNFSFSQQLLNTRGDEDDQPVQTRTNLMEQKKAQWMRDSGSNQNGGADNWPFGKPGPGAGPNRQRQQQIEDMQNANPFMYSNGNKNNAAHQNQNQDLSKSKKYIDKLNGKFHVLFMIESV